jgi:hypothetical protein
MDRLVLFGDFGEKVVRDATSPDFPITKIPHGVDSDVFRPLVGDAKLACARC